MKKTSQIILQKNKIALPLYANNPQQKFTSCRRKALKR